MRWNLSIVACTIAASVALPGFAETTDDEPMRASQRAAEQIETWKIQTAGGASLDRERQPVLRWSNPAVGRVYGDIYLYTHKGRPAAICSIYQWFSPHKALDGEFLSLSGESLAAERGKTVVWKPRTHGIDWKPVPGAPVPADSLPTRLAQMRQLARVFRPEIEDRRNSSDGERQVLRLLTQPVFRYEPTDGKGLDGGLFAFVVGTDPEVWLMVEARRDASGGLRWEYALARMNRDAIRVKYQNTEVFRVESIRSLTESESPYYFFNFDTHKAFNP